MTFVIDFQLQLDIKYRNLLSSQEFRHIYNILVVSSICREGSLLLLVWILIDCYNCEQISAATIQQVLKCSNPVVIYGDLC